MVPKATPKSDLSWCKIHRFSIGFTTKVETCAIMEREARKVQEKQYAGNRKEQVCPSSVIDEMGNKYNKGTMRN